MSIIRYQLAKQQTVGYVPIGCIHLNMNTYEVEYLGDHDLSEDLIKRFLNPALLLYRSNEAQIMFAFRLSDILDCEDDDSNQERYRLSCQSITGNMVRFAWHLKMLEEDTYHHVGDLEYCPSTKRIYMRHIESFGAATLNQLKKYCQTCIEHFYIEYSAVSENTNHKFKFISQSAGYSIDIQKGDLIEFTGQSSATYQGMRLYVVHKEGYEYDLGDQNGNIYVSGQFSLFELNLIKR